MSSLIERIHALSRYDNMTIGDEAADEIERALQNEREGWDYLRQIVGDLARYFTSANNVPVERATIKADDFWRIVGERARTSLMAEARKIAEEQKHGWLDGAARQRLRVPQLRGHQLCQRDSARAE